VYFNASYFRIRMTVLLPISIMWNISKTQIFQFSVKTIYRLDSFSSWHSLSGFISSSAES